MKKPYVKKIEKISDINVWLVDGEYIRKNICEDFVNFDQHYHLKFIPKNEFWINKTNKHHENRFYITHLLVEHRLMKNKTPYARAFAKAAMIEKKEREKLNQVRKLKKRLNHKKEILEKIHKKIILKNGFIKIWSVRGDLVRDLFLIDFAEGGHGWVYSFVPENEIWIEDNLSQKERKSIILHELHERNLMKTKKWDYRKAHRSATKVEDFYRNYLRGRERRIQKELSLNK
jgi:hypothetical protein